MTTTQGNAVVDVQATSREKDHRQDVVGLQMISPTAAPARTVAKPHGLGPLLARLSLPERLLRSTVHVVWIVFTSVQPRQVACLRFTSLAGLRAVWAVAVSVLAGFIGAFADFANKLMGPRVGQRLIDRVQQSLVTPDRPDVFAEVFAGLEMGTESLARLGHHVRVRIFARRVAKPFVHGMSSAPSAVLFGHESIIRGYWSLAS